MNCDWKTAVELFDSPVDSPEHRMLSDSIWLAGRDAEIRYYLGRLLGFNLFRQSDEAVAKRLEQFVRETYSLEAAALLEDPSAGSLVAWALRYRFGDRRGELTARVCEAFLRRPNASDEALALELGTTIQRVRRITEIKLVRKLQTRTARASR